MLQPFKIKNMMNLKPIEIANKLIEESKIDIFKNTRKRNYIELRSLLCFLLRKKLNMRWIRIAKFFNDNNKKISHASCIHSFNHYEIYCKSNKNLKILENLFSFTTDMDIDQIDRVHYLENKCKLLETKLEICKKIS